MPQFEMKSQNVKVDSVNPFCEKHGEENHLAASLKISADCANTILDLFEPAMRKFLFRKPAVGEQQTLLDGDGLTQIRNADLAPQRLDVELTGYTLRITRGMGLSRPLEIEGVDLKKFVFEAREGGTVSITFNVVCHPDTEQMGQLCDLIQEDIELSLVAPAAERKLKAA